jgi:hypothetical protein
MNAYIAELHLALKIMGEGLIKLFSGKKHPGWRQNPFVADSPPYRTVVVSPADNQILGITRNPLKYMALLNWHLP